ncbi:MAG: hypothetical protein II453_20735 [Alphaproteobacteria bacterium]|nr:hypothetical protein [Alphaproteobacteria bacterium]
MNDQIVQLTIAQFLQSGSIVQLATAQFHSDDIFLSTIPFCVWRFSAIMVYVKSKQEKQKLYTSPSFAMARSTANWLPVSMY